MKFAPPGRFNLLLCLLVPLSGELTFSQTPTRTGPPVKSVRKKPSMIPTAVDPNSTSAILRASHILLIRIESERATPWVAGAQGPHRTVDLTVRIEEILKGAIHEPEGSVVSIKIEQTGLANTRIYALPGVWSEHPIDPGTRLVAFSSGVFDRAADLLVEPLLQSLLPAEEALFDVQLAMKGEFAMSLHDIIVLAQASAAGLHYTFAEYLSAKASASFLKDRETFRLLGQLVEAPDVSLVVRSTLISNINADMVAHDPAPAEFVSIWVTTLFHIVEMPAASALHDNILQVFLPNLLGIKGGATKKRASDLFRDAPKERQRAESALATHSGAVAQALSSWLRE